MSGVTVKGADEFIVIDSWGDACDVLYGPKLSTDEFICLRRRALVFANSLCSGLVLPEGWTMVSGVFFAQRWQASADGENMRETMRKMAPEELYGSEGHDANLP